MIQIKPIQLPTNLLDEMKGQTVNVELKNGMALKGKLIAYDLNLNLSIEIGSKETLIDGQLVSIVFY